MRWVYGRLANRAVMVTSENVTQLLAQWVSDSSAARKELGFEPKVLCEEAAQTTPPWYVANHRL